MVTIHKEELAIGGETNLLLPKGAEILSCQIQHDVPCIYYKCDPVQDREPRTIKIYGTGREIDPNLKLKFIDSIQMLQGTLIFHVFEDMTGKKDERTAAG